MESSFLTTSLGRHNGAGVGRDSKGCICRIAAASVGCGGENRASGLNKRKAVAGDARRCSSGIEAIRHCDNMTAMLSAKGAWGSSAKGAQRTIGGLHLMEETT